MIQVDKNSSEIRIAAKYLLGENQATARAERMVQGAHDLRPQCRPQELEGIEHHDHLGVRQALVFLHGLRPELHAVGQPCVRQFLGRLLPHAGGRLDPDEPKRAAGRCGLRDARQGGAGRAADVVDRPAVPEETHGQFDCHPLDLGVEGHAALKHVVEDRGDLLVEDEVVGCLLLVRKQLVSHRKAS
jgi:hypothetical protein